MILLQANIAGAAPLSRSFEDRLSDVAGLVADRSVDLVAVQSGLDEQGDQVPLDLLCTLLPDFTTAVRHAGMAILSRIPASEGKAVALTGLGLPDDSNERHLLVASLPDQRLTLMVANFSWAEMQAQRNVEEAIAALADRGDALLVGDFNQQPDSAALAMLSQAGFADAWPRLHPGDAGLTFEIGKPWGRLDYVLERAEVPVVSALELVAADPESAVSNHALLLARIDR